MSIPADLKYTSDHEWIRLDGDIATVGITAFAADALGDVVYVDLPQAGSAIASGDPCGEVESTKSVSDLYAPVTGEVAEVNAEVVDDPSLVNAEPFARGWLFRVKVEGDLGELLDADAYAAVVESA
ncbi:MAG: glycine cleavage system protein GcvH [Terrabacter sp.]|nr:glycine cleavage system protein GcvH [Dermatophilaceae bacterium]NUR80253.1 glycine cleavage system protein GcvH [Dermatophilaceae bacterium]NUS40274.1 glycine cleavage system protein GcvH [Terrabacter sp.]